MITARREPRVGGAFRAAAAGLLVAAALAVRAAIAPAGGVAAPVVTMEVKGPITSGTTEYFNAALARAKAEGAAALVVTLDTPGGALDATREIVQSMLASDVPEIVWVGPAGARAGSAGVFLTLAANVAAMHPASNIGAAHPVTGTGRDVAEEAGKDMAKKVENDTAAFARTVAAARGRNADWAEKAVRESESVTAADAVRLRVVDLVAPDLAAVLAAADGRKVSTAGGERTLALRGAPRVPFQPTVRQRVLMFLADPNVMAILMLIGLLGIAVEFYHPGAILPGAVGALCLLLAFLAMRVIPVNVGAVLLVLVGTGLMVMEGYLPSHGIAVVGGAGLVVLGTVFFIDRAAPGEWFDPSGLRVSPWIVWPTPLAITGVIGFMAWKVAHGRRAPLRLGAPALVGARGEALSEVGPAGGQVFVHGEYWMAFSAVPIPRGARVRVEAVDGLKLTVVADDRATG